MTFFEALKAGFAKYAEFDGRAGRSEYWWFLLAMALGSTAASVIGIRVYSLFTVATILPLSAMGARRLHDTNRSGWWQLLALVPFGVVVVLLLMAQPTLPPPTVAEPVSAPQS